MKFGFQAHTSSMLRKVTSMTLQQIIIYSRLTQVEMSFIVSGKNLPVKETDEK